MTFFKRLCLASRDFLIIIYSRIVVVRIFPMRFCGGIHCFFSKLYLSWRCIAMGIRKFATLKKAT